MQRMSELVPEWSVCCYIMALVYNMLLGYVNPLTQQGVLCSFAAAQLQEQKQRATVTDLESELVGFKDRIRVAEGELAKNAPLIAQLSHSNQNMGNRVHPLTCYCCCLWVFLLRFIVCCCCGAPMHSSTSGLCHCSSCEACQVQVSLP